MLTLREITDANRAQLEALRVHPHQWQFINSVADALVEAAEEPGGRAIQWAIYADETPVGFVMISDEVDGPEYIAHFLWKLLIDARCQGRGYGRATLDLVASMAAAPLVVETPAATAVEQTEVPRPAATATARMAAPRMAETVLAAAAAVAATEETVAARFPAMRLVVTAATAAAMPVPAELAAGPPAEAELGDCRPRRAVAAVLQ